MERGKSRGQVREMCQERELARPELVCKLRVCVRMHEVSRKRSDRRKEGKSGGGNCRRRERRGVERKSGRREGVVKMSKERGDRSGHWCRWCR